MMQRSANYSVPQSSSTPVSSPRQTRTSPTISSAFSAYANPDEDWTKISDFGERRRVQSRIAQRNFRSKQKKRMEQAENRIESGLVTAELPYEELDASTQGYDMQSLDDTPTPETLQQQYPPLRDDCVMPLQQFPLQLPNSQAPCAHVPPSRPASRHFHTYGSQQPSHHFHNGCGLKVPHQQCQLSNPQLSNHDCFMVLQQFTRQYSNSPAPCACISPPGHVASHSQTRAHQQQPSNFYESMPQNVPWPGSENYARGPHGPFKQAPGSPTFDTHSHSPFIYASQPTSPYLAHPSQTMQMCCCQHHNYTYPQGTAHAGPLDSYDIPTNHPFQDLV